MRVDLDSVAVTCEGTEVARHRRCLAAHQSILAPEHARIPRAMRAEETMVAEPDDAVEERDFAIQDAITEVA